MGQIEQINSPLFQDAVIDIVCREGRQFSVKFTSNDKDIPKQIEKTINRLCFINFDNAESVKCSFAYKYKLAIDKEKGQEDPGDQGNREDIVLAELKR